RHAQTGSIKVPKLWEIESFANVHHLVSTVTGELASTSHVLDLLKDSLPGGSITGAPKQRAMEVINELETVPRSVYCGSIGHIGFNGDMNTNIAIRTLLCETGKILCWGGGGIVADSCRDDEYQESISKVANLMNALERHHL
ncbi:MAG: chorismate-binding protein, partial [Gammaproteobacteria bacterium]|nr:chorismate-binding protein [Gammaproteobacteria bacterium]